VRVLLAPLRLEDVGMWNTAEHYWGEEGEPLEEWAKPTAARGLRPALVMEQVLPGWDAEDPFFRSDLGIKRPPRCR